VKVDLADEDAARERTVAAFRQIAEALGRTVRLEPNRYRAKPSQVGLNALTGGNGDSSEVVGLSPGATGGDLEHVVVANDG
jgi:hypothetical protein